MSEPHHFSGMNVGFFGCNDKRLASRVAIALEAYEKGNTGLFMSTIKGTRCLQNQMFPVKGGVALIAGNYFLIFSRNYNEIYNGDTHETWRGKPSTDMDFAVIDLADNVVSRNMTADKSHQILVLFCQDRVYLLYYPDKKFGYYERGYYKGTASEVSRGRNPTPATDGCLYQARNLLPPQALRHAHILFI